jgi:hypothetical protein
LQELGRLDEAVATIERAVQLQRTAAQVAPDVAQFREFLDNHLLNYAKALQQAQRPNDAARASLERAKLWPADPERLFQGSVQVARAASQLGARLGLTQNDAEIARDYDWAQEALELLRRAVEAGFRDHERIAEQPELAVVRQLPDFPRFMSRINDHQASP